MPLRCIVLVLSVLALAAVPAQAAPRTKAAAAFSDAALRAKVALQAGEPAVKAKLDAMRSGLCLRVVKESARSGNRHRFKRALAVTLLGGLRPLVEVFVPVARQLVAELDAVPTRDPALIRGRDAWRRSVAAFEGLPVVERPCERLGEWRASGYSAEKAPPYLVDELEQLEDDGAVDLALAARRLRQLGVSRRAAERFAGEDLVGDVYLDLDAGTATLEPRPTRP